MVSQESLHEDLRNAMRAGDTLRRDTVRLVLAGIKNLEVERGHSLADEEVQEVIGRQVKQHRESIEEFKKGRREDLVAREEAELQVLLGYLPPQMGPEEIRLIAQRAIQDTGAQSRKEQGKVMGRLAPELRGKADLKVVSQIVTELLPP